jgi:hypothetical protein
MLSAPVVGNRRLGGTCCLYIEYKRLNKTVNLKKQAELTQLIHSADLMLVYFRLLELLFDTEDGSRTFQLSVIELIPD